MSDVLDRIEELEAMASSPAYAAMQEAMHKRAKGLSAQALNASTDNAERPVLAGQWRELTEWWIGWAEKQATKLRDQIKRGGTDG